MVNRQTPRLLSLLMLMCWVLPLMHGCEGGETASGSDTHDDTLLVGFSMATLKEDRWLQDRDIFISKAKQAGIEVIVSNANNDTELQFSQVRDMVAQNIDVLVIAPHDRELAADCVALAKKEGIPVISYDRLVTNADVDVYISFDNVKVGRLQGEGITQAVPKGGYIVLNGSQNDNNSIMFREGYMEMLQPLVDSGAVEITAETWVENWRRETAFEFVSQAIKDNPGGVGAIIAANDSLAWGAIDALAEARLADKVKVVGHDADLAACQRIVVGTQMLTVYKPIKNLVEATVAMCKTLAAGQPVQAQDTIFDGSYDVPYVMIDVVAVTKDNIDDTVIRDGFHLREDVYRSIKN
ncbi:MAG: sugar ABC transporter substrate-binding protein [Acetanaerobacterium sp.]